jgi:hypothetical protein
MPVSSCTHDNSGLFTSCREGFMVLHNGLDQGVRDCLERLIQNYP